MRNRIDDDNRFPIQCVHVAEYAEGWRYDTKNQVEHKDEINPHDKHYFFKSKFFCRDFVFFCVEYETIEK